MTDSTSTFVPEDANTVTAWSRGELAFQDATVSDVLQTVARWSGYKFHYADSTSGPVRTIRLLMAAVYTTLDRALSVEPPDDVEDQNVTAADEQAGLEDQPMLLAPELESWVPPQGFLWIEATIMANVFLYGFDTTITAATYAVISSDFDAANTASWLTTSYLITSTAFQPLYGRFSDIFGWRACFFVSTVTFALGCLGCGVASNIVFLNCMRALAGFGGGGLMTMGLYAGRRAPRPASLILLLSHLCLRPAHTSEPTDQLTGRRPLSLVP